MKTIGRILLTAFALTFALNPLLAQTSQPDDAVALAADSTGLTQVDPAQMPVIGPTCWWIEPGAIAIPMPFLPPDLSGGIWQIAPQQFLVDQTGGSVLVNPRRFGLPADATAASAVAAEVQSLINLIAQIQATAANPAARPLAMAAGIHGFDDSGGADDSNTFTSYNTYPTNGLWLEMVGVTNGLAYLNLHCVPNLAFVYEIMSQTELTNAVAQNWNIEQEVFPPDTNQTVVPFTVPEAGRTNLFLWGQDWSDVWTNGVPAWWSFYWFGNLTNTVDSSGNPLLTDYQNYTNGVTPCDPNVISFTVSAANLYVSSTTLPLAINLQAGIPYFVAVLVNDTNYADAVWQPYTGTNLTVTLGATDGIYDVWVGLKGLPADATLTWDTDDIDFTLDRVAPTVSITSPAIANGSATVLKPYLQLQGVAAKPLASLSYDISNVLGAASFIAGQVTDVAGYDPVYCQYMTNCFQCYDVPLATNDNFITLRVTDIAGNTTTTNFDVVLDYTGATNPPVVNLLWPRDGMAVSGTNITIRGTMSDETGTIQAQIVDASGDTNIIAGLVERNGMFWIENVPLNGTSQISIQAVDAAGNATTNNITIMPSALTLTINSTPTGDDLYQPSGTVSGTVGDPDAVVTVNGVAATVDDSYANDDGTYNWCTNNVPIYGMGTATFDATATPGSGSGLDLARGMDDDSGSDTANASLAVDMGAILTVTHYSFTEVDDDLVPLWWMGEYQPYETIDTRTMSYDGKLAPDASGQWRRAYQASDITVSSIGNYTTTNAQNWSDPDPFYPDIFYGGDEDDVPGGGDFCVGHNFAKTVHHHWDYPASTGPSGYADVTVNANTRWTLYTGGKAVINPQGQAMANATSGGGPQSLFAVNAGANSYERAPSGPGWDGAPINGVPAAGIDVLGQTLGGDFNAWTALPNNVSVDLGLTVLKANDAGAWATFAMYHPYINLATSTTNVSLDWATPEVCVGQLVTLGADWWGGLPPYTNVDGIWWHLPNKFVNQAINYSPTCTTYVNNYEMLTNLVQQCWYVNQPGGACSVRETLHFSNGQSVNIAAAGNFSVYRPSVQFILELAGPVVLTPDANLLGLGAQLSSGDIIFHAAVTSSDFSGDLNWTQLIKRQAFGNGLWLQNTLGIYWLDNDPLYNTVGGLPGTPPENTYLMTGTTTNIYFSDRPTVECVPINTWIKDSFRTYLVFHPAGDGIWVTLGRVRWGWSGFASDVNMGSDLLWQLDQSSLTSPLYTDTDEFPEWPSVLQNSGN